MGQTLRYKLFGIGKLPDAVRSSLEGEEILILAEGIPVTKRRSGKVPGAIAYSSISALSGALLVTRRRIVGTVGPAKAMDLPWQDGPETAARLSFDGTGARLQFDLARVSQDFSGTMSLHFKRELTEEELGRLPGRSLYCPVSPQGVIGLFRRRG